jgi:hypothetical protein
MGLNEESWRALKPRRAAIQAALVKNGLPFIGWCNHRPVFADGFEPNWDEIEDIALNAPDVAPEEPHRRRGRPRRA